jgi:hypothetical protein
MATEIDLFSIIVRHKFNMGISAYFLDAHNMGVVRAIKFILYSKVKISPIIFFY